MIMENNNNVNQKRLRVLVGPIFSQVINQANEIGLTPEDIVSITTIPSSNEVALVYYK
jgi:hypothetical protein